MIACRYSERFDSDVKDYQQAVHSHCEGGSRVVTVKTVFFRKTCVFGGTGMASVNTGINIYLFVIIIIDVLC